MAAGVKGILDFAGGYKYTGHFCTWEKSLVDAFESYGRSSIPSISDFLISCSNRVALFL
jgi:hypothetical protein